MYFLRGLLTCYRLLLTALFAACLSGSAVLTCLESDTQEQTCCCEHESTNSSLEFEGDGSFDFELSVFESEWTWEASSLFFGQLSSFNYFIQAYSLTTHLGLNLPPPELG